MNIADVSERTNGVHPSKRTTQVMDAVSHAASTSSPESDVDDTEDKVNRPDDSPSSTRKQNNRQENGVRSIIQESRNRRASLPRKWRFQLS